VLITHGPPAYKLDWVFRNEYVGCADLDYRIQEISPKYHFFGHIHESRGIVEKGVTTYVNASMVNENYSIVKDPIYQFEI
jgi:Icc-related predicted phosphoesterase